MLLTPPQGIRRFRLQDGERWNALSFRQIGEMTDLSEHQIKRAVAGLRAQELITRRVFLDPLRHVTKAHFHVTGKLLTIAQEALPRVVGVGETRDSPPPTGTLPGSQSQ